MSQTSVKDVSQGYHSIRFVDAKIFSSDFRNSDLRNTTFAGATISGATNMQGVDLRGATLNGASIWNIDISKTKLDGADLHGAKYISGYGVDAKVQDLENVDQESTSDKDSVDEYSISVVGFEDHGDADAVSPENIDSFDIGDMIDEEIDKNWDDKGLDNDDPFARDEKPERFEATIDSRDEYDKPDTDHLD